MRYRIPIICILLLFTPLAVKAATVTTYSDSLNVYSSGQSTGRVLDYIGPREFHTYKMEIEWTKKGVLVHIYTNYPGADYDVADLAIDLDGDGVYEIAVKMAGGRKGKILRNPIWRTSDEIFEDVPGFVYGNGALVHAEGGTEIGEAIISWTKLKGSNPDYRIDVLIPLASDLDCDRLAVAWGTATCGNSQVWGEVQRDVPEFTCDTPIQIFNIEFYESTNCWIGWWSCSAFFTSAFSGGGGGYGGGYGYDYGHVWYNFAIVEKSICHEHKKENPVPIPGLLVPVGVIVSFFLYRHKRHI